MITSKILFRSFLNAFGTLSYISLVSLFFYHAEKFAPQEDTFLSPILFLLLFVVSATITASLVLGKPIQLYISNLKKEAFRMLVSTVGWLALFLVIVVAIVFSG